jgi:eukaryotic-like serine/threonine-protein kinase
MGAVYEARHTVIGRRLAVKFLHGEFARRSDVAQRFENEARAAGEIEHENIAGIYDVGALPDGTRYLVMEFLDGEDLEHLLKREHRLPLHRAADLLTQACHGLAVVHPRGIVHRDLKPANLFLTKRANGTEVVKILDFGIAKLRRPDGDATATETGAAIGTAHYMSPEQARGESDVGTRSDVYALGVILYELLSGRRPHDGTSALEILHQILTLPPTPLEEVCPELPEAVYRVVRTAMAGNAADRFVGVGELADALAPFAGGEYRPAARAPMEATHIEAAAVVRPGTERPRQTGSAPQSIVGMARSAAPSGQMGGGLVIGAASAALVVMGAGAFAWTQAGKGASRIPPPSAAASSASTPLSAPSPVTARPSAGLAPAAPPPVGSDASGKSVSGEELSGQERASGHSGNSVPATESPKFRGPGDGSELARHPDVPSTTGHRAARETQVPSSQVEPAGSKASTKPDCAQTYTIDPEGNRIFRPECFRKWGSFWQVWIDS